VQPSATPVEQHKTTYDFIYAYGSPRPHAATHIDDRTFTFDANGNETGWTHDLNGTRRTVVWDDEDRIQSIFDNGHENAYKHDDQGERIIKRGPQGETVYVNQYFTMRNGAIGTKHFYAGPTRVASKLLKKNEFEKDQYYFHPDHLGSSNYITDLNGALYEHLEYFPSGESWVSESSNTQRTPYLFTGKEFDEETDLYYYGARYYDPRTNKFMSTDPLVSRQTESVLTRTALLNVYAYAVNNPLRYNDPTGLEPNAVTDIKVKYDKFTVPGTTMEQAVEWLKQNRPGEWGNTGVEIVPDPNALQTDAKGKVAKATVKVVITVTMPEWTPPKTVGPKAKAEGERVRKALLEHEGGHVKIAQKEAKDVASKLVGKTGKQALNTLTNIFDESKPGTMKKEGDAYDTKTKQGATQGVNADYNIERAEIAEQAAKDKQKQQQTVQKKGR